MHASRRFDILICLTAVAFFCFWLPVNFAAKADGSGSLTIVATNYPPFEMALPVDGLSGFDHEVVTEAFKRVDRPIEIVFVPWKRAITEVRSGKAAAVLSCAYRKQREDFAYYSDQISSSTDGVFYRKSFTPKQIAGIEDLIGESVAAVNGYASSARLKDLNIVPFNVPDDQTGVKMLRLERFDYFYNGRQATDFLIKQSGSTGLFNFMALEDKPLFLCVSKAYPEARRILQDFNKGLASVKADGTYSLIHAKYK